MKRGKRKAKKGFVYILHAIHEGINIYKYGATTNNPESRLRYAKSRVWRGTDIQNKLDFKIIIESKQKDIFHVEGSITTMLMWSNMHPENACIDWPIECDEIISSPICLLPFLSDAIARGERSLKPKRWPTR